MAKRNETILPYIEWEFMNKPITISSVNEHPRLPNGSKKIIVTRDEDYNLKAVLTFNDYNFIFPNPLNEPPAGSFIEYFDITGSDYLATYLFTLENCHIYSPKTSSDNEDRESSMEAKVYISGFRIKTKLKGDINHLTEWCLNGPYTPVFSRNTARKLGRSYAKERFEASDKKLESITITNSPSSHAMDYLLINAQDYKFVVAKVPEQLGPNWSSNIGIEYRTEWGKIPNSTEREEIIELLSFVFGRQLLPIGYSAYDKDENLVESYSKNPWGYCAKSYCAKSDFPPIYIDIWHKGQAEKTVSQLLPRYQQKCEDLHLKEAIWNYWVSQQMPVGTNLTTLSAGVESIIYGWFNNKSSSNVFLDKDKFENLLQEEIKSIENKLKDYPDGSKILENILRSNEAGIMKRYRIFFEEVGLKINDNEWEAINERHVFVHGKALLDKIDWRKVAIHAQVYEVLFNKIVLKVLGYSGSYIDYTTLGCPEAQLM